MATDKKIVGKLIEGLSEVRVYPMMGEYVLYCKEKVVGDICDNRLFVKITPASKRFLPDAPELPPYEGAKPYLLVERYDKAFLQELLFAVADELPIPKRKKKDRL